MTNSKEAVKYLYWRPEPKAINYNRNSKNMVHILIHIGAAEFIEKKTLRIYAQWIVLSALLIPAF